MFRFFCLRSFSVEDIVDVDPYSFKFFSKDIADTIVSGDVAGNIRAIFCAYGMTEGSMQLIWAIVMLCSVAPS